VTQEEEWQALETKGVAGMTRWGSSIIVLNRSKNFTRTPFCWCAIWDTEKSEIYYRWFSLGFLVFKSCAPYACIESLPVKEYEVPGKISFNNESDRVENPDGSRA
jgi:hypothetical protein